MNLMELDVHMSLDGEVVIAHDADLERMCGEEHKGAKIKDMNYAELPPMKRKINMHLSDGGYTLRDDEDGKFTLLKDLFAHDKANKNTMLYSIDIKDASETIC